MSDTHHETNPGLDPLASLRAERAKAADTRRRADRADAVYKERLAVWEGRLAAPTIAALPDWVAGWLRLVNALRMKPAPDLVAAADALRELAGQLRRLQGIWNDWQLAHAEWYRTQAAPVNTEAAIHGGGNFAQVFYLHPDITDPARPTYAPITQFPEWIIKWSEAGLGPGPVPEALSGDGHITLAMGFASEVRGEVLRDVLAVYIGLIYPEHADELLADIQHADRLSALALPIAATILPAPEIISRFLDGEPSPDSVGDAKQLLTAASGVIGDRVLDVLNDPLRRWAVTASASPTHPNPAVAKPADPSPVKQEPNTPVGLNPQDEPVELAQESGASEDRDTTISGPNEEAARPRDPSGLVRPSLLSCRDISRAYGLKYGPLSTALTRFAGEHRGCRESLENPAVGTPRYLYKIDQVMPVILQRLAAEKRAEARGDCSL